MPRGRPKNSGKQVEKVPISYDKCGEDVEALLKDLIRLHHSSLVNANFALLYKNKEMMKGDTIIFATVQAVGPKFKALTDFDFLITIPFPTWNQLGDTEKRMVLDHELCHCFADENEKTGDTKYKLLDHDFSDFLDIARRYGLNSVTCGKFADVLLALSSKKENEDT
jgi:hypothetical protein